MNRLGEEAFRILSGEISTAIVGEDHRLAGVLGLAGIVAACVACPPLFWAILPGLKPIPEP
jgi:hypothetical protein